MDFEKIMLKHKKYRLTTTEDGIKALICSEGTIQPSDLEGKEYVAVLTVNKRRLNNILRKFENQKLWFECMEFLFEADIKFLAKDLDYVTNILKIKKKKVLSEEHLAKLLEASHKYRFSTVVEVR